MQPASTDEQRVFAILRQRLADEYEYEAARACQQQTQAGATHEALGLLQRCSEHLASAQEQQGTHLRSAAWRMLEKLPQKAKQGGVHGFWLLMLDPMAGFGNYDLL